MPEVAIKNDDNENCFNKLRLCLRTLVHLIYVFINYGVALYGCYVAMTLTDEQLQITLVQEMKKFIVLLLTNWNYVSI